MNRFIWRALAGAVVIAGQGSARASDPAAAQSLFQQARSEAAAGEYDVACPRFEESFRLDPQVGTLLNMGDCAERLGHIAAALAHFTDAASQLSQNDDRAAYVNGRIARLKARVPRLSIDAASREPLTVLRDQVEVGSAALNILLPIEPGLHVIVVRAPGHNDREFRVDLAEGAEQHLRVEPGTLLTGGAATSAAAGTGARGTAGPGAAGTPPIRSGAGATEGRGPLPWVLGGLGVAGIALGSIAGGLALHEASIVQTDCPGHACSEPDYTTASEAASRGSTWATVSTVAFAAGGVAAVVAIYLWVRPLSHSDHASQARPSSASLGRCFDAWMVPWGDHDSAGLMAGGHFE